jgi:hypothetical protein
VGYSRALWKTATSEFVGEVGLDYTYQRYVLGTPDAIHITGLGAFVGYIGNPAPDLSCSASVEHIGNLNSEETPTGRVNSFGDNRPPDDSAPAPKPPPAGFSWAAGYQPLANPWDTFTEFVLVYKLLYGTRLLRDGAFAWLRRKQDLRPHLGRMTPTGRGGRIPGGRATSIR